jgi:protein-L-isoaspartate(D-aspartate) O-methyltransferase
MSPSIVQAEPTSAVARRAMVDNQIRTFDVTDKRVLAAFEAVPRELFLPKHLSALAYSDAPLAVACESGGKRRLLTPMVLARMFQALDLVPEDHILVVGAGTGYAAAIASELCNKVVALESAPDFVKATEANLQALGSFENVVFCGPLNEGVASAAPYTAILVCGAVETRLEPLLAQLEPGGRLLAIEAASHDATERSGKVVRFDRFGNDISSRVMFDATAPVLDDFRAQPVFTF